jgi:hypothetical protein
MPGAVLPGGAAPHDLRRVGESPQEPALRVEHLDLVVAEVGYVHVSVVVDLDAEGRVHEALFPGRLVTGSGFVSPKPPNSKRNRPPEEKTATRLLSVSDDVDAAVTAERCTHGPHELGRLPPAGTLDHEHGGQSRDGLPSRVTNPPGACEVQQQDHDERDQGDEECHREKLEHPHRRQPLGLILALDRSNGLPCVGGLRCHLGLIGHFGHGVTSNRRTPSSASGRSES